MNKICYFVKQNEKLVCVIISALISILYFLFLLRFYLTDYFVPDFGYYGEMAVANLKAADGFSSLFIWIAGISRFMPHFITICCLFMLSASIFNILYFYIRCFYINAMRFSFLCVAVLSTGIWYYFYGKIFYDFPFSVFTYSLCLLQMAKVILNNRIQKPYFKNWIAFFMLAGLTLSWKPYNIFMLTGLLLCSLVKDETRSIIFHSLHDVKKVVSSFGALILGYIIGNFNLVFYPRETIEGIKAYKASFPIKEFLYEKHRIIWDHVNDLPFCISVFSLTVLLLLFVLIPLFTKRKRYVAVFAIILLFFSIFIENYSPGWAWHGFPLGISLITLILFLFSEKQIFSFFPKIMLFIALGIQLCVNFGLYVPTQIHWHNITQKAIAVLENHNDEIIRNVQKIVAEFEEETFYIEQPVKRIKPVRISAIRLRPISFKQPYIVFDDIRYCNPLESYNFYDWDRLYRKDNSVQYRASLWNYRDHARYLIYVKPSIFDNLGDIADVSRFKDLLLVKCVQGEGYSIYVYDTGYKD